MKRFTLVSWSGDSYLFPGVADQYVLSEFEPLTNELALMEQDEILEVTCTVCLWDDGGEARDLLSDEVDSLAEIIDTLLDEGKISVEDEPLELQIHGVLPEPFEDYFELEGEERERYLKAKAEYQEAMSQAADEMVEAAEEYYNEMTRIAREYGVDEGEES